MSSLLTGQNEKNLWVIQVFLCSFPLTCEAPPGADLLIANKFIHV